MKILLSCQFFNYCSGSQMYVHDLALELKRRGHEITILSDLGGEVANSALKSGINLVDFSQIFSIQDEKFDIMHLSQYGPAEMAVEFFPDIPAVFTIHSEIGIEQPYRHPSIKKYIGVRPSIIDKYKDLDPVLIWNGIDFDRFNKNGAEEVIKKKEATKKDGLLKEIVLFVGTIDNLRAHAIKDLIEQTEAEHQDLWLVGRNFLPFSIPKEKATMLAETFFVEKWTETADICAGILIGRTAIEAWACGKPYICYNIDETGKILSKEMLPPPADMSQYDIKYMTDKVEDLYKSLVQ